MKDHLGKINDKRTELARELGDTAGIKNRISDSFDSGRVEYNHEHVTNAMVKAIMMTPMPDFYKKVLLTRLLKPDASRIFLFIANDRGVRLAEILQIEEHAKEKVKDFLKMVSMQSIVGKFNSEGRFENDFKSKFLNNPEKDSEKGE